MCWGGQTTLKNTPPVQKDVDKPSNESVYEEIRPLQNNGACGQNMFVFYSLLCHDAFSNLLLEWKHNELVLLKL